MEVHFDENFWGKGRKGEPGELWETEKQFVFNGRKWRIPAVYLCREGIAVDCCVEIPLPEIRRFFEKWRPISQKETLEEEAYEQAELENPFHMNVKVSARINGKEGRKQSSCGVCWSPLEGGQNAGEARKCAKECGKEAQSRDPETALMEEYHCDRNCGWNFQRFFFLWPDGEEGTLRSLILSLEQEAIAYPGPHFRAGVGTTPQVAFEHPVTGSRHVLQVLGCRQDRLPQKALQNIDCRMGHAAYAPMKWPEHFLQLEYRLEPSLNPGELQILDCVPSDRPVAAAEGRASAISVIGGANGPTSLFVAGKLKEEPQTLSAFSSMHFEPAEETEWRIRFQVNPEKSIEVPVIEEGD